MRAIYIFLISLAGASCSACTAANATSPTAEDATVPQQPRVHEVVPGELRLTLQQHTFRDQTGDVPCWVIATDGLLRRGQKELVFMVPKEAFKEPDVQLRGLADFVAVVWQLAGQKRTVDVGDYTALSPQSTPLLGRADFRGILYWTPEPNPGLVLPDSRLTAVVVTDREVELAMKFGVGRITARLGEQVRYYPVPPWSDPRRKPVVAAAQAEASSILSRMPVASSGGLSVSEARTPSGGHEILLSLPVSARGNLAELAALLSKGQPFAWLSIPTPAWDSQTVWHPGATSRAAIGPEGSAAHNLGGNFVALAAAGGRREMVPTEDGLTVFLPDRDLKGLARALEEGVAWEAALDSGASHVRLHWRDTAWKNPVDGAEMTADWTTATPQQKPNPGDPRLVESIILLSTEEAFSQAMTVRSLTQLLQDVEAAATLIKLSFPPGQGTEVIVQCNLGPKRPPTWSVVARPELPPEVQSSLMAALDHIAAPSARREVAFQVVLELWGGNPGAFPRPGE